MAASQRPKTASTNKLGGGRAITTAIKRCLGDLERAPLAPRTKDAYSHHVAAYGAWLTERRDGVKALADPKATGLRRSGLQAPSDRGWKPSSVNLALAAVDHFNRFLGLGPVNVKREPLAQAAPGGAIDRPAARAARRRRGVATARPGDRDAAALHRAAAQRARLTRSR